MQWEHIRANWARLHERAREQWPEVSAEALERSGGEREALIDAVAAAQRVPHPRAAEAVDGWAEALDERFQPQPPSSYQDTSPPREMSRYGDI